MVSAVNAGQQQLVNSLFPNQETLADSHERLDEQFTVLTRLVVTKMNDLIGKHNKIAVATMGPITGFSVDAVQGMFGVDPVTYEGINEMFVLWATLRDRPDFRDHLRAFYLGDIKDLEDVKNLPPPEAVETEVPDEVQKANEETAPVVESLDDSDDGFPEGAQIFGGDYGEEQQASDPDEEAPPGEGEAPQLHVVRESNGVESGANNAEEGGVLPEVQDLPGDDEAELNAASAPESASPA